MSHLRCTRRSAVVVFYHAIVQLRRHSDDHVIEVGIEVSAFWNIMAEGRVVMEPSHDVVGIVDKTRRVGVHLGEVRRPHSLVGAFGLMHSEVRRPHSVVNDSLSVVPFLEEITFVLLVSWVQLGQEYHFVDEFSLLETLVDQQIIFLVNSSVTALASPLKHLESSPQSNRSKDKHLNRIVRG